MTTGTSNNDNANADGQHDRLTRDVMPMATVQSVLNVLKQEIKDHHRGQKRAEAKGNDKQAHFHMGMQMGLNLASALLKTHILDQSSQHEDTKSSPTPSA